MKWIKRLTSVFLALITAAYATVAFDIFREDDLTDGNADKIVRLDRAMSCANGYETLPGMPFLCRQFLASGKFKPEEIDWLNKYGTFEVLEYSEDRELVEKLLPRMVLQGLNINRQIEYNQKAQDKGWTALHVAAYSATSSSSVWWIPLLMKNGARTDLKDSDGKTPLNLAEEILIRNPDNKTAQQVVSILLTEVQRLEKAQ